MTNYNIYCAGYFSGAVIRCHDLGNLQKKGSIWAYSSRGLESIITMGRKHGSSQAWWLEQQSESSHLQDPRRKQRAHYECCEDFTLLSTSPEMCLLQQRQAFQTFPITPLMRRPNSQKPEISWDIFSFKQPQQPLLVLALKSPSCKPHNGQLGTY